MSEQNWKRYAEIWLLPENERRTQLAEVATPDVVYTDPTGSAEGAEAFISHITEFQKSMPGTGFQINEVLEHHDQSLAKWDMVDVNGSVIAQGTSFAHLASDGKFRSFAGFFKTA